MEEAVSRIYDVKFATRDGMLVITERVAAGSRSAAEREARRLAEVGAAHPELELREIVFVGQGLDRGPYEMPELLDRPRSPRALRRRGR